MGRGASRSRKLIPQREAGMERERERSGPTQTSNVPSSLLHHAHQPGLSALAFRSGSDFSQLGAVTPPHPNNMPAASATTSPAV